ncbi:MAG: heavy-metal-associated domain-containing protein [Bacteroidales bacterium]|nr:heavy-metal-associated domain-containing protein [Bacteroidales bacterium]
MKQFIKILLAVVIVAMFSFNADAQNRKKREENIAEVTFVSSIDCAGCVKKVEGNIPYEKGVRDLKVNLEDQTIYIKYDATKTDKEKLAAAIVKLGYTAEEKVAEEEKK